ncbi:hypothetical protein FWJ25_10480 [Marinobacter salinexigens]|uniref:Lipoprotein n=1 Tax=Marinobacter salinexigens TaxID=2919747 RepID=A0A5B0VGT1_9GAMM|nr:hypothetical protein [Marinobacter salinexigens]KAA1173836.1 hypothetical protein FWJ25_10480 [Marinobacter salinexigens]
MGRILITLLLAALVAGCANVSRFERGALVAFGEVLGDSPEPLYYLISIDLTKATDDHILEARLQLAPDTESIPLSQLGPEIVASYLPPFVPPTEWPEALRRRAEEDDGYSGGGFSIRFRDGILLSVGACSHCAAGRASPVIVSPDQLHYYPLPLTFDQITEVFGEPDRVYKVGEVRY